MGRNGFRVLAWGVVGLVFCFGVVGCGGGSNVLAEFGGEQASGGGMAVPVSEEFGVEEARKLYERVSAGAFLDAMAKYNCGDPVPRMTFRVTLHKKSAYASRRVDVDYSVRLDPAGRQRGMVFGLSYLVQKAAGEIDPTKTWTVMYQKPTGEMFAVTSGHEASEPILDCSKRDSGGEWVTFAPEEGAKEGAGK